MERLLSFRKDLNDLHSKAKSEGYKTAKLDFQLAMSRVNTPFPMMKKILEAVEQIEKGEIEKETLPATEVLNIVAIAIAEPIREAN